MEVAVNKNAKSGNRTIYFYTLKTYTFDMFLENGKELGNKHFLDVSFKDKKTIFPDNDKVIEIIDFNNNYIFGSVGKLDNKSSKSLRRARDKTTYEQLSNENIDTNFIYEDYTYFLIGNNFNDLVVLKNSDAPKINSTICKQLNSDCQELSHATIIPKTIDNLKEKLSTIVELLSIEFVASHEKSKGFIPSIKEMEGLSTDSVEKVKMTVELKKDIATKGFLESLDIEHMHRYSSFKLTSICNDSDLKETIDILKKIVTKKVSLDITNDTLKDGNAIKNILIAELSANIKRNCK